MSRQAAVHKPPTLVSPEKIGRKKLIAEMKDLRKEGEISWFITDSKNFEWDSINLAHAAFFKELSTLNFKRAFLGIFYPETKETEYRAFEIRGP